jgi:Lon protease-like protein
MRDAPCGPRAGKYYEPVATKAQPAFRQCQIKPAWAADVATQLVGAVGTLARIIEIDELKDRLEALERAIKGQKQ